MLHDISKIIGYILVDSLAESFVPASFLLVPYMHVSQIALGIMALCTHFGYKDECSF